ncbi:MAG: HAD family hydrolase [Actinomycetes bacterium]
MTPATRRVAAFDFDGTITRRDTLGPFLVEHLGRLRVVRAGLPHLPRLGAAALGRSDRDAAKDRYLTTLLRGHPADDLERAGRGYAQRLLERRPFHPAVVERLDWHREQGHRIVVISASLAVYVEPVARALGADAALATRLEVADGRLTGHMAGGNVRAAAKVRHLERWLGPDPAEVWAYGDSAGDDELLARADHAHRVRGGQIVPGP